MPLPVDRSVMGSRWRRQMAHWLGMSVVGMPMNRRLVMDVMDVMVMADNRTFVWSRQCTGERDLRCGKQPGESQGGKTFHGVVVPLEELRCFTTSDFDITDAKMIVKSDSPSERGLSTLCSPTSARNFSIIVLPQSL